MLFVELIAQGLVQGSIYALIALGLTLVYGLLRILHVAHAALFTLGGYIGVLLTNQTGSLGPGHRGRDAGRRHAGVLMYRFCYEPILHQPPFIAADRLDRSVYRIEEIYRLVFGAYGLSYANPPLQGQVMIGALRFKQAELLVMVGGALAIGVLALLQSPHPPGLACQATVTDPQMAESFGINLKTVRYVNFFVGSALAGAAGVMVALLNNLVEPTMGSVPSYKALAIIVLGGLGSIPGTLMAALTLGVVEAFGTVYLGKLLDRNAIAFAFLILVLMVRPQGLFARR